MQRQMKTIALVGLLVAAGTATAQEPDELPAGYPAAGVSAGGAMGLGRVVSATSGDVGAKRFGLRGGFFQSGAFPDAGATNRAFSGELSAGWTALEWLEVFGAYRTSSNSNTAALPSLVQAQGDLLLGAKATTELSGIHLGADVRLDLRNGIGKDLWSAGASNVQLRGLVSHVLPVAGRSLTLHANLGAALGASDDALDPRMTPTLLFGTGISGYHRLLGGIAAHYDLGLVSPFLTFDMDVPLGVEQSALADADTSTFGAASKRFAVGARIKTSAASALDVMLEEGSGHGVAGFAPTQPWMLTAGWSFAFDSSLYAPPPPPAEPPAPTTGRIAGTVTDLTGAALAGAIVSVHGATPVATDAQGRFLTHEIAPGPVTLHVERAGFLRTSFEARVAAGRQAPAEIRLDKEPPPPPAPPPPPPPPPAPATGFVAGRFESTGPRLAGRVVFFGAEQQTFPIEDGTFSARLKTGVYRVLVLPESHYARTAQVTVLADRASAVVATLEPRSTKAAFTETNGAITPAQPLVLDERKAEPDPKTTTALLRELSDRLVRDERLVLRIAVHADAKKAGDDRKTWTDDRAQALRRRLIELGAPEGRVEAKGYGLTQPLDSKAGAKNRRVELSFATAAAPAPAPTTLAPMELPADALDLPMIP